tara:strand:- start:2051 stop:2626 length:576 start_codon:yes stop_codon:yes gene_type:complete
MILMDKRKKLIILTGPSGVGKGTLIREFLKRNKEFWLSVSSTTRSPRSGEAEGVHYYFITKNKFEEDIKKNNFLEWAEFAGNLYGTPKNIILTKIEEGKNVLLEIELEGARQVKQNYPDSFSVFISPPSLEELERRIRFRGTEKDLAISKRLERAKIELEAITEFDQSIINDDLEESVLELEKVLFKNNLV